MCGIYGTTRLYTDDIIQAKLDTFTSRGPDNCSFTRSGDVTLGHRRLAIIDLDARSNQPFTYGEYSIVFNGEIYNFQDLRSELQKDGYTFSTSSDTEVLLAAYDKYGVDVPKKLNGMFAFCIHDRKRNLLFGSRDRFGKKPFYYSLKNDGFEFASAISAIRFKNSLTLNEDAVLEYLHMTYVPDPYSIFNEVNKLQAGHSFTYNLSDGSFREFVYWDLPATHSLLPSSFEEAKEQFSALLDDAVKIRMISDVPLGVFLSGGIDSSLVAAYAQRNLSQKVKTFSIKFTDKEFDESIHAQRIAEAIGTEHHNIECNPDEGIELIRNFSRYYDEPFADASAIPSLLLCRKTKEYVTVALTGDGGDENMMGYHFYDWLEKVDKVYRLPLGLRRVASSVLQRLGNYRLGMIGKGIAHPRLEDLASSFLGTYKDQFINGDHRLLADAYAHWMQTDKPLFERVNDLMIKFWLTSDSNVKVDRASMAFSLETRSPFLDYRLIEYSKQLPMAYKRAPGAPKRLTRELLYDIVGRELVDRPKRGFTMPFKNWFRNELREYVLDTLSPDVLKKMPWINAVAMQKLIDEHMEGKGNHYPEIWSVLVLKQWLETNNLS